MKYFITLFLIIFCIAPQIALADPPEFYVAPDGETSENSAEIDTAEAPPPPAAVTPTTDESGKVEYKPEASTPPCGGSSTCITNQSIANANHDYVQYSAVKTYIDLIDLPKPEEDEDGEVTAEAQCKDPIKTGMIVYRQSLPEDYAGGSGILKQHDDAFCINQGCVYFAKSGEYEECRM